MAVWSSSGIRDSRMSAVVNPFDQFEKKYGEEKKFGTSEHGQRYRLIRDFSPFFAITPNPASFYIPLNEIPSFRKFLTK